MYAAMKESASVETARSLAEQRVVHQQGTWRLPMLEEQVCSEAGIWDPETAARAIAQAAGDLPRAVALLKVWAAALPHLQSLTVQEQDIKIVRRLSSAFADIPGGQWLGIAPDLASRMLKWDDNAENLSGALSDLVATEAKPGQAGTRDAPNRQQTVRVRTLLNDAPTVPTVEDGPGLDPAEGVLSPPLNRATRLGLMGEGGTGALVALAALVLGRRREAVLAEMTVSETAVQIPHPRTGRPVTVAEVPVVEAEAVLDAQVNKSAGFALGWGATFGSAERRAIALALLDGAMQADGDLHEPLELDEQTLLGAIDGSATNGFVEHLRLPHHASFASYLSQARANVRDAHLKKEEA